MNTEGIIGHSHQIRKLETMREKGMVPHTILMTGTPGIGKKIIARRLINSLLCGENNSPCLKCRICLQFAKGTLPDMIELSPDEKGTIPIGSQENSEPGSVRWLIERLSKKSVSGIFGVIIDGAETISVAGQNALLKTIEEPQKGAYIIILTANKSQILTTIQSRSAIVSFNPLTNEEVGVIMKRDSIPGDTGLIPEISGGSAEMAIMLSNEEIMNSIAYTCGEISTFLREGSLVNLDLNTLQKKVGFDNMLTALTNIYRAVFFNAVSDRKKVHPLLAGLAVPDSEKLVKLIKIFLALRKGLSNNLNIRNALKGLLYSINSINGFGLPNPDFN